VHGFRNSFRLRFSLSRRKNRNVHLHFHDIRADSLPQEPLDVGYTGCCQTITKRNSIKGLIWLRDTRAICTAIRFFPEASAKSPASPRSPNMDIAIVKSEDESAAMAYTHKRNHSRGRNLHDAI